MENITKLYMTVNEACERYGIGRTSLYATFQMEGCPELKKFGNKTLLPVREFDAFFESLLEKPKMVQQGRKAGKMNVVC